MPPKNCGSCQKMVYPMDELKCLDKTWHKGCFRCQVCSMTLNMKNYKGYNKLPYCNAHYPTTKFTAVADTPENMRIKQNTKLQSNIKYHAEFEAAKGQYTSVADDPETLRVRKNMNTISNVAYHGELMRKQEMENARPTEIDATESTSTASSSSRLKPAPRRQSAASTSSTSARDPGADTKPSSYSSRTQSTTEYSSSTNGQRQAYSRTKRVGSITDYDPINDQYGSIVGQYTAGQTPAEPTPAARNPVTGQAAPVFTQPNAAPVFTQPTAAPVFTQPTAAPVFTQPTAAPRHPSPVREPSPPPAKEPSPPPAREPSPPPVREPTPPPVREPTPPPMREPSPVLQAPVPEPVPQARTTGDIYAGKGNVSQALYDYTAGDEDEVGFVENDLIINCEAIDEGWMNGTVERTGETGMLPSNYVEKTNW